MQIDVEFPLVCVAGDADRCHSQNRLHFLQQWPESQLACVCCACVLVGTHKHGKL